MLNKIILSGNIGETPHVFLTQEGQERASFSLATSKAWKNENSEWQTRVEWHQIVVFRKDTITWIKRKLQKGDTVYVEGRLIYHLWKDKFNQPRLTPKVAVFDREGQVEYLRSPQSSCPSHKEDTLQAKANFENRGFKNITDPLFPKRPSYEHNRQEEDHSFCPTPNSQFLPSESLPPLKGTPCKKSPFKGLPLRGAPLRDGSLKDRNKKTDPSVLSADAFQGADFICKPSLSLTPSTEVTLRDPGNALERKSKAFSSLQPKQETNQCIPNSLKTLSLFSPSWPWEQFYARMFML